MRGMPPSYRARPGPASRAGSLADSGKFPRVVSGTAGLFRPGGRHETKRTANETILGAGEDVAKPGMVTNPINE
ncbi:hypothetical protein [Bradyrhizobium guangdongense]|uniref:hypothetical protein n=1 Tax=Bradyrhizobium guangdongense TaxID=1325090 RepID=UPI001319FB5A|nr:hypothetical protein [Bradyrhizobium guangdongense]